jgi:hypothetical protein
MIFALAGISDCPVFLDAKRARRRRAFRQLHKVEQLTTIAARVLLIGPELQKSQNSFLENGFAGQWCFRVFLFFSLPPQRSPPLRTTSPVVGPNRKRGVTTPPPFARWSGRFPGKCLGLWLRRVFWCGRVDSHGFRQPARVLDGFFGSCRRWCINPHKGISVRMAG